MLQNIEGIYCLNNVPYTGTAWTAIEGFFTGDFTTSEETCRRYAGESGIISYEFENGVMVEF
jgi:hypothetical protein